jgi:hypothetical protein
MPSSIVARAYTERPPTPFLTLSRRFWKNHENWMQVQLAFSFGVPYAIMH